MSLISSAGSTVGIIALVAVVVIFFIILVTSIRVVRQGTAVVIERFGRYHRTLSTGINVIFPFIDRARPIISVKEKVADFPPQPIITKDNVTMQIDTVVYYQITDPKLYCYGVERPISAIENLTATTLRNIIGEMELDETLTSRDTVNSKMRAILDEATDPWGIKINRVELKNIDPPRAIREAMEKQMKGSEKDVRPYFWQKAKSAALFLRRKARETARFSERRRRKRRKYLEPKLKNRRLSLRRKVSRKR